MKLALHILTTLIISLSTKVYAQISPSQRDSVLHRLNDHSKNQLVLLDYLISNYYVYNELDSVEYYCNKLKDKNKEPSKNNYSGNIDYYLGTKYAYLGQYDKAIPYINSAINKHRNNTKLLAYDYNLLSLIYTKNQKPKDFEYGFKALKLFEKIKDTTGIIRTMKNISVFYYERDNEPMKDIYMDKIFSYLQSTHTKLSPSEKYMLTFAYYAEKNLDSTLFYVQKTLEYDQKIACIRNLSKDYYYLGEIYYWNDLGSLEATKYYQKALALSKKSFKPMLGTILYKLGQVNYENTDYLSAVDYCQQAYSILDKEHDWSTLEVATDVLYNSYYKLKQYDSAFVYGNKKMQFRDSLYFKQIETTSLELSVQYESQKKELQIEKLQLKQKKDKQLKQLLIGGLLVSLLGLFFVIRNLFLRRKKNRLEKELLNAEKEKVEQDLQHKTRELTSQTLMMLQKNKLLEDILQSLSSIKNTGNETHKEILSLKRRLKRSMQSDKDWKLFRQYFEQINKNFFSRLKEIAPTVTSSEMKLSALIKLRFSIKESASLLNISDGSVKTARYQLRKKLGLKREDNLYDYLNDI